MCALPAELEQYLDKNRQRYLDKLVELAKIPAPSGHEEKRAAFCRQYMESFGAKGVTIDPALNVIYPFHVQEGKPATAFLAHMDVVFPDMQELPIRVEDDKIYGPGIGDNSANVVALMELARMFTELDWKPKNGILFVCNTCEEGLGNLKGARRIVQAYKPSLRELIAVDGSSNYLTTDAVGCKRYRITLRTEGGHSYAAFGNQNAIAYMARLINLLYAIKAPAMGKTTYNVGTIEGGTSVNSIAQECSIMYEYRSDKSEGLAYMDAFFHSAIATFQAMGVDVEILLLGDRPCKGNVDVEPLADQVLQTAWNRGVKMRYGASSTDCNIPLSEGIPAVSFGVGMGGKAHTYDEWLSQGSTASGMKLLADVMLKLCF